MEDSSLSKSGAENKGKSDKNEPIGKPVASSVGVSPSSEVNGVSFSGFFFFSRLRSASVHFYIFPSRLRFGLGTLLKCPLLLLPLSLIRQTRVNVPLFVSLSLHSPPHSLTPSFSRPLSLPISD